MSAIRVLWVDLRMQSNEPGVANVVSIECLAEKATSFESARDALRARRPNVIGVEFDYPDASRLAILPQLLRTAHPIPVLMITEFHSEALAIQAFRWGVWDYRVKPISSTILARDVEFAVASSRHSRASRACDAAKPNNLTAVEPHLAHPILTTCKTAPAVECIAERYAHPISRRMVARACHLSESEFTRLFRREHQCSFETYLLEFRLSEARDLLASSPMTITQIAHAVGFNDSSYFSRAFRRASGTTASEWRRATNPVRPQPACLPNVEALQQSVAPTLATFESPRLASVSVACRHLAQICPKIAQISACRHSSAHVKVVPYHVSSPIQHHGERRSRAEMLLWRASYDGHQALYLGG